tara:strand:- start:34 stop:204 length:171 start_codon:yes stop_codon:yes gene_type:complete
MENISENKKARFIGIGLTLGIIFGAATDNVGLGIALGLVLGAGIGTSSTKLVKKTK